MHLGHMIPKLVENAKNVENVDILPLISPVSAVIVFGRITAPYMKPKRKEVYKVNQ